MAATTRTFQDMLNEYLTYDLLKEEMIKRDYLLTKIEKDNGWKGGTLPVPFKAAGASSVAFGGLTDSNDVHEDKYVRGSVATYKEVWGTMLFNHKDLMEHDGKINEKSFLKILPDAVEDFMGYMKGLVSVNLLGGPHFDVATANGTAAGVWSSLNPDRFVVGQKVVFKDDDSVAVNGYVDTIDINTAKIHIVTARNGAVDLDLSPYTTAQNAKAYHVGALTDSFTSLRSSMLSLANGGSATLYGQTKLGFPYLQTINIDGSAFAAATILDDIFDGYTTVRRLGKGNANEVLMSYRKLGAVLKLLEVNKGPFNVQPGSQKTSVYGWTEIVIGGVKGSLKVVGIQEMDEDIIMYIDWRSMKFHSNGFFRKRIAPDGKHYFEVRATDGYKYLIDMMLFGELILNKPSMCGIAHSIPTF